LGILQLLELVLGVQDGIDRLEVLLGVEGSSLCLLCVRLAVDAVAGTQQVALVRSHVLVLVRALVQGPGSRHSLLDLPEFLAVPSV
jgi:hypothetical protein